MIRIPPNLSERPLRRLKDEERLGPSAIGKRPGIGRASVYRLLATKARDA